MYIHNIHIASMYVGLYEDEICRAVRGLQRKQLKLAVCAEKEHFDLQQWGPFWQGVVLTEPRVGAGGGKDAIVVNTCYDAI